MEENQAICIERLFKSIYNDSPIGIGITDSEGKLVDLNYSCMELFGVSNKTDIIGFNLLNSLNIPKEKLNLLKNRTTVSHEVLFNFDLIKEQKIFETTKSGKLYINMLITLLSNEENNSIFKYLIYFQDISVGRITEQKLRDTKIKLKEEKKNLFNVLNALGSGIYIVNPQYDVIFINNMLKRELGALHGKKCFEYFFNRSNPCPECKNKLIFNGKAISQEFYSSKVNKVYEIISTPLHNLDGTISKLGIFYDISARKLAIKSARESQQLLENTFNALNDAVFILNTENPPTILRYNSTAEKIFGYSAEEMLKKPMSFLHVNKKSLKEFQQELYPKIKRGEVFTNYKYKMKRKDGSVFPSEHSVLLLENEQGKRIGWINVVRDLTIQMEAEQKLKETEDMFQSFVESTPVATFLYQNYECIYANPAVLNLTEYSLDEIYAMKFWDFVHPDYRNFVISIGVALERNEPIKLVNEIKIITKSGIEKWINGNMVLLEYKGNRAALISAIDITQRKKAEQRLISSEERYRNFVHNFQGIAFRGYIDFSIDFFHGAIEEITGYQPNDFILEKIKWNQIIHPDDIQGINEKIKEFHSSNRQSDTREYRIIRKDGDIRWVLENSQKVFDPNKKMECVQGLIVDITERKIIEKKLKESEEKYRNLFDNAPFAIMVFNIEGDILDCNEEASKISGYKKSEMLGRNFKEFDFYEDIQAAMVEQRQRAINTGIVPASREILLKKKDNSQFWARTYIDFIQLGKDTYIQAIIQDITERKQAREELNKLSKIKSELLTRTSHELKTPAMHIKGYIDLLLHTYKDNFNKEELNIIRHIKKGVLRLETLIYDILHKAELDSGGSELNIIENNLSSLIELSVKELNSFAALRGHSIILNIHSNININFDRDQIRHVINNLITNAIKYTPLNGTIEISSEVNDDFVTIAVHDNGIGIIEKEKERLFSQFGKIEHFGQGFDIITEGSGLGLYITKKVIDLHGGEIWVESEGRNKGSTFYFSLPVVKN
ncbi:MAG: PAS domain S-box protein [Promethearchaeota archaeon]